MDRIRSEIGGLHHVTAVTGDAPGNLDFYTRALGLRLVKKTVNQDDVTTYHLFYADGEGSPGTDVTFFDWPHTPPNRPGAGEVAATALRVAGTDALAYWFARLDAHGVAHDGIAERNGRATLSFRDPEGQRLALVEDGGAPGGVPWHESTVPSEMAIKGLAAATLVVSDRRPTEIVLEEVLGFRRAGEYEADGARRVVWESGPGGPGAEVHVEERPDAPPAMTGRGGVHHVAFRAADDAAHRAWRERVAAAGLGVTSVIDRYYFKSIYFREPGGVLFEIATDGPGFAADEDPERLGEGLALPPFLEPRRAEIEAGLRPLPAPSE